MYSKFIALALCIGSIAGAQVGQKSINLAKKTADNANARTEALGEQQQAVVAEKKATAADTVQKAANGAPVTAMPLQAAMPGITREVFAYDGGGRRDPFTSLTRTGALRPHISELYLRVVIVQTNGGKSVATIRDSTAKETYQVRVGDSLGRYRVVQIEKNSVTFAIEEFGYSRQEKLIMTDNSKVRNQ